MPLMEKYKQSVITGMDAMPCRRCGMMTHITRKCTTPLGKCYKLGMSKLGNDELATGSLDTNTAEAEALWADEKNKLAQAAAPKPGSRVRDRNLGQLDTVDADGKAVAAPTGKGYGVHDHTSSTEAEDGNSFRVLSNYVRVAKVPDTLYVYSLSFSRPNKDGPRFHYHKRRDIREAVEALRKVDALDLDQRHIWWTTDFKSVWTTESLDISDPPAGTITQSKAFPFTQADGKRFTDVQADLTFMKKLVNIENNVKQADLAELPEYIRALNACVAQCVTESNAGKQINRIGANKFYLDRGFENIGGLRAVRGYFTSIRPGSDQMLLNINPVTSAFLPPHRLSDFIRNNIAQQNVVTKKEKTYLNHLLKGARLKILYRRSNYVGNSVDYNSEIAREKEFIQFGRPANVQKFYKFAKPEEGKPRTIDSNDSGTTVSEYLKNEAKVELPAGLSTVSELLCVNVGKRVSTTPNAGETIDMLMRKQSEQGAQWIPAYLLQIIPGQMVKTTLSGKHTKQMIDSALRLPAANAHLIEAEGLNIIGVKSKDPDTPLASRNFDISEGLLEVPAQTLDQPKLRYSDSDTKTPRLGHWNLSINRPGTNSAVVKFRERGTIESFHMLEMPGSGLECSVKDAHGHLVKQMRNHGLAIGTLDKNQALDTEGLKDVVRNRNIDAPEEPTDEWYVQMFVELILKDEDHCGLIVIPDKDYDLYAYAKRLADFGGRHLLFAIGSKFTKEGAVSHQYLSNIALKINIKMGGENHHFEASKLAQSLGSNKREDTIVLGADIGHTGAGSPSVACVVGSVNGNMVRYPGSMRLQSGGQEIIEPSHLFSMVQERLCDWHAENKDTWPKNMLFYRDGISESQFAACKTKEIEAVKSAFRDLTNQDLNLTFVICGKRHHTRFYAMKEKDTYRESITIKKAKRTNEVNGNLKPGLLVTEMITSPNSFNFFLQSHKAIKGTARSAHYHVLEDGMNIGNQNLPGLTMVMCYAFGRATCGVSYAAPAYIADRLCERGRIYLREWNLASDKEPKLDLTSKLDKKDPRKRLTQEEIDETKKEFAQTVAETENIWGSNYGREMDGDWTWENPWEPLMNKRRGMFWM